MTQWIEIPGDEGAQTSETQAQIYTRKSPAGVQTNSNQWVDIPGLQFPISYNHPSQDRFYKASLSVPDLRNNLDGPESLFRVQINEEPEADRPAGRYARFTTAREGQSSSVYIEFVEKLEKPFTILQPQFKTIGGPGGTGGTVTCDVPVVFTVTILPKETIVKLLFDPSA